MLDSVVLLPPHPHFSLRRICRGFERERYILFRRDYVLPRFSHPICRLSGSTGRVHESGTLSCSLDRVEPFARSREYACGILADSCFEPAAKTGNLENFGIRGFVRCKGRGSRFIEFSCFLRLMSLYLRPYKAHGRFEKS